MISIGKFLITVPPGNTGLTVLYSREAPDNSNTQQCFTITGRLSVSQNKVVQ